MNDAICTTRLFHACRLLFGPQVDVSLDFLNYLQENGVKEAYRRRARETHPDRAAILKRDVHYLENEFKRVSDAYRYVMSYVDHPQRLVFTEHNRYRPEQASSHHYRHNRNIPFWTGKIPFGRYLYFRGLISYSQLIDALVWQKASRPRIGELGKRTRILIDLDITDILRQRKLGERFGDTAYRLGILTQQEIERLLTRQRLLQPRIGKYFVAKGIASRTEIEHLAWEFRLFNNRSTYANFRPHYHP